MLHGRRRRRAAIDFGAQSRFESAFSSSFRTVFRRYRRGAWNGGIA